MLALGVVGPLLAVVASDISFAGFVLAANDAEARLTGLLALLTLVLAVVVSTVHLVAVVEAKGVGGILKAIVVNVAGAGVVASLGRFDRDVFQAVGFAADFASLLRDPVVAVAFLVELASTVLAVHLRAFRLASYYVNIIHPAPYYVNT